MTTRSADSAAPTAPAEFTVVCCPDSFKGTATAQEAAEAMAAGVRDAGARAVAVPMADGGEGTAELLAAARAAGFAAAPAAHPTPAARPTPPSHPGAAAPHLVPHDVAVTDALGRPHRARWWELPGGGAILDLASASGLPAVADHPDALAASTFGTGQLLLDALANGAGDITVCLGGSATTDGGSGLLIALGASLYDDSGRPLPPGGGAALARCTGIDLAGLDPRARRARWTLVLDVTTPPRDAPAVFGPQKGASPTDIDALTDTLIRWCRICGVDPGAPGFGAAGATPVGVSLLPLGAGTLRLESGAELMSRATGLRAAIGEADLVLTGEGSIDEQSHIGKVVGHVLDAAGGVPVHLIGGRVEEGVDVVKRATGTTALPGPLSRTRDRLRRAAFEATLSGLRAAGRHGRS